LTRFLKWLFSFTLTGFHPHLLYSGSWKRFVWHCYQFGHLPQLTQFTVCSNVETISALQLFRKRHADAVRVNYVQATQPTTIDFAHYRSVLKNQAIVDEAEKLLKGFKPVTYDVNAHIKAIETFEAKAVRPSFLQTITVGCSKPGQLGGERQGD
jgi:hypothetical protein